MAKGSSYEREVCKQLSLWWTQDLDEPREDIFWRSTTSGARATARRKKGKTTSGQEADIAAIDPIGKPLLDFMVLEVKRGYNRVSPHQLLDKSPHHKEQKIEEWIRKQQDAQEQAGSFGWAIMHKRDKREPMIYVDAPAWEEMDCDRGRLRRRITPAARYEGRPRRERRIEMWVAPFYVWLKYVHPSRIPGGHPSRIPGE